MRSIQMQTQFMNIQNAEGIAMEKEYRCPVCKRLLMRGKIIAIETRCPKCKKIITITDSEK